MDVNKSIEKFSGAVHAKAHILEKTSEALFENSFEKDYKNLTDYLNKRKLFLVQYEDNNPVVLLGKSYLTITDITGIDRKEGTVNKTNLSYFYKEIDNDIYLFFLIYLNSRSGINQSSFICLLNDDISIGEDHPNSINSVKHGGTHLCSIVQHITFPSLISSILYNRLNLCIILLFLLASSNLIMDSRKSVPLYCALSVLFHLFLFYDGNEGILIVIIYIFFVIISYKPFWYCIRSYEHYTTKLLIFQALINIILLFRYRGIYISYYSIFFLALMFNANLLIILLLKALRKEKHTVIILIALSILAAAFFIYLNEINLSRNIMLKLKTISLEEDNLSKIISMDVHNSINRDQIYEKLLSGRVENESFQIYTNSIASRFQKDVTIILFDSRAKITDRFSLRDRLEHVNIDSYIEDVFQHGFIELRLNYRTSADIYISGELMISDNLVAGGILLLIPIDYYDNELQIEKYSITETLFSDPGIRYLNWLRPLAGRNYYYLAIKNRNIIHVNQTISFTIPELFYDTSIQDNQLLYPSVSVTTETINNKRFRIFTNNLEKKPVLIFMIEDYDIITFAYIFVINAFWCIIAFVPFALYFLIPVLIQKIDIKSLKSRIGISILLLSLLPILLVFYILQNTLSRYFNTYNTNEIQRLAVNIKENISNEIGLRTERILISRIMSDFIDNRIPHESLERYLLSQYHDTPVSEITISFYGETIYELQDMVLKAHNGFIYEGMPEYFIANNKLFVKTLKRFRDIEATIVFELTNSFLRKLSEDYTVDIGFSSFMGFFELTTFDFMMDEGVFPYSQGMSSYFFSKDPVVHRINNYEYAIYNTYMESSKTGLTIIKQKLTPHILHTIIRINTIIFSFIFLAVFAILTKINTFISENIRSFIYKLNLIKEEKIESINTKEISISEFNRIAEMINSLLNTIYQNNIITSALIKNIPIAILLMDSNNNIIHSNTAYTSWLPIVEDHLNRFLSHDSADSAIFPVFENSDRRVFKFDKYIFQLSKENSARLVMITEISKLLELEEAKLRASMAEKFAHDIKNPLMPIKLYIQHLSKIYERDKSSFIDNFKKIADNVMSQIEIIEGILLRYSKIRKEDLRIHRIHKIKDIFQSVKDSFLLERSHMHIEFIIENPESEVILDKIEFFNTLNNLIRNSIDSINIDKQRGKIKIQQSILNSDLIIILSDNGQGMPSEIIESMNKKEYSSNKVGGFGIGLKLTAEFIESMQGTMLIDSGKEGTTIKITLPGIVQ